MKNIINSYYRTLKQLALFSLKDFTIKYLNHYLWPRRVINRLFSYDIYYPAGLCVNLGGGPYFYRHGWINADFIDGFSRLEARKHLDLGKCLNGLPFEGVNAYYLSHTLEHFHVEDAKKLLIAAKDSMREGGIIRIVVPDAELILNR